MATIEQGLAWADARRAEALDLVRIFLGLGLFVRGVLFLAEPEAYVALVPEAGDGFFFSNVAMHFVALAHLGGGLLLALGLLTRLAAVAQLPVLAGAVALHAASGPLAGGQSFEFAALVLVLLVVFAVWGAGPLSLDRWLARKNEEEEEREARIVEATVERLHAPPPTLAPAPDRAPVAQAAAEPAARALPTCSCGHDRTHGHVVPGRHYNFIGALPFFSGVTPTPTRIVFRCRDCGEVVEDTRDRAVMRQFRYRRYAEPGHPDWAE
jgi:uncharacterized membrane protein YphA (DoxX/SURF4 family)